MGPVYKGAYSANLAALVKSVNLHRDGREPTPSGCPLTFIGVLHQPLSCLTMHTQQ